MTSNYSSKRLNATHRGTATREMTVRDRERTIDKCPVQRWLNMVDSLKLSAVPLLLGHPVEAQRLPTVSRYPVHRFYPATRKALIGPVPTIVQPPPLRLSMSRSIPIDGSILYSLLHFRLKRICDGIVDNEWVDLLTSARSGWSRWMILTH